MSGSFALFPNAPGRRGQQGPTPPLRPAQTQADADGSADGPQTAAGGAMPPVLLAAWRAGVASAGRSQFSQFTTSVLSHGSLGLSSTMTAGSSFTSSVSSTNSALSNESGASSSSGPAETASFAASDADGSPTWTLGSGAGGITAAMSPAQMHEFKRGLQAGQQAAMDALRDSVESIRASLADIKLLVQEAASAEQASDGRRIEALAAQIAAAKAAALRRVAALQTATDPQTVHAQPHAAAIARTVIPNLYSHHRQTQMPPQMHSQTQFPATAAYPTAPQSHSISAPSHQIQSSNSQLDPFVLGFAQSTAKIHQQGNRFANSMRQKILATPTPGKPSIQNALDPNHFSVGPSATATTSSNGSASTMSTRSVSSINSSSSTTANRTYEQPQPFMLVENRYSPIASGFGVLSLSAENSSSRVGGNDMHIEPDASAVNNQPLNTTASFALNEDTNMLTAANDMLKQHAMNPADASRDQDDVDMDDVNQLPSSDPSQQAHQTDISAARFLDVSQSRKQGQGDVVSLVASDASKIKKVIRKLVKFKREVHSGGSSAVGSPARAVKLVDDNMAESVLTKTRKLYMSAAIIQSHMRELLARDALLYPSPPAFASQTTENPHSSFVDERQQQQIQSNTELLTGHAHGRKEAQQFLEKSERILRDLVCSIFSRWPTVALPNFDDIAMTASAATSGGSFARHGIPDQRTDHASRMMGGAGDQMHALTSPGSLASQQTMHGRNDAASSANTETFLSASTTSFPGTDSTDPSTPALKVETNLNGSAHPPATSAVAVTAPSASSVAARAGVPGTTPLDSRRARSKKLYKKLFGF